MSIARKDTPNWSVHPGEVLREEFLKPMKMSVYRLAKELHVPAPRVNDIVLQKRGITADALSVWRNSSGRRSSSG